MELQHIEQWRQNFQQQHAIVSKVDFDIGTVEQALKPSNLFSWGYWLKYHCRCIWGSDLSSAFPLFQPARRIAQVVNADLRAVLEQYFQNIAGERVPAELQLLKREAARKLIRATNMQRDPDSLFWPIALNDYVEQFLAVYPDKAAEVEYLLAALLMTLHLPLTRGAFSIGLSANNRESCLPCRFIIVTHGRPDRMNKNNEDFVSRIKPLLKEEA